MPPSATLGVALSASVAVSPGSATDSSPIVAAPLALTLPVLPLVTVAVSAKVSLPSAYGSSVVATRSWIEVWPAGIVTLPATGCQALPSKNSSVAAVSVATVAVPETSAGVKTTGVVDTLVSDTVKTAKSPSTTVGLETARLGVSSSLIVVV